MPREPVGARRLRKLLESRAGRLTPDLRRAIDAGYRALRQSLSDRAIARAIREGTIDSVLSDASVRRAFEPVRREIVATLERATGFALGGIPGAANVVGFNVLDEGVRAAILELDTKVMGGIVDDAREAFRATVAGGLDAGTAPLTIARRSRSTIGLASNHVATLERFEGELRAGRVGAVMRRKLRDRRFDSTIRRAVAGGGLTDAQVERMVGRYRDRLIAHNAKTHARSAVNDSLKRGQALATEAAIRDGVLPRDRMRSRWLTTRDGKQREEHDAMHGEVVPYGTPFSNGQVVPGETDYNCRCIREDFVAA